jgi:hypothetical protein
MIPAIQVRATMGIKSNFVPLLKGLCGEQFLKGNPSIMHKTIAVDLSPLIHLCLHRKGNSDEFHMSPSIPLKIFAFQLKKTLQLLISIPIRPILVCDGSRHPHKKDTDDGRAQSLATNKAKMDALLKRSDLTVEEKKELDKLKRSCVWVREDVLATALEVCSQLNLTYICGPFEADFQVRMPFRVRRETHIHFLLPYSLPPPPLSQSPPSPPFPLAAFARSCHLMVS